MTGNTRTVLYFIVLVIGASLYAALITSGLVYPEFVKRHWGLMLVGCAISATITYFLMYFDYNSAASPRVAAGWPEKD